jgi:hypothetical protein
MEQAGAAGNLAVFDNLLRCAAQEFERLKSTLKDTGWI